MAASAALRVWETLIGFAASIVMTLQLDVALIDDFRQYDPQAETRIGFFF